MFEVLFVNFQGQHNSIFTLEHEEPTTTFPNLNIYFNHNPKDAIILQLKILNPCLEIFVSAAYEATIKYAAEVQSSSHYWYM